MSGPQPDAQQLGPLLARSRAGDTEALNPGAPGLGKLRPYLHVLVRSRLGPDLAGKMDNSDLVQDVLLRVHCGFSQFAGHEVPQLLAWVGEIVRNVIASDVRYLAAAKRNVRREVPGSKIFQRLLSGGTSPSARAQRDEDAAQLADAIERLPDAQRAVIQMRFFDQLDFGAISERTGKSKGAIRIVCLRAIRRLRQIMEQGA